MKLTPLILGIATSIHALPLGCEEINRPITPQVIEMAVPKYPASAKIANISGYVSFLVQTDGSKIEEVLRSFGPPMLVLELKKFISTWRFEPHKPKKFSIQFDMKFSGPAVCPPGKPDEIKLVLPSYIEMVATRTKECDPVLPTKAP